MKISTAGLSMWLLGIVSLTDVVTGDQYLRKLGPPKIGPGRRSQGKGKNKAKQKKQKWNKKKQIGSKPSRATLGTSGVKLGKLVADMINSVFRHRNREFRHRLRTQDAALDAILASGPEMEDDFLDDIEALFDEIGRIAALIESFKSKMAILTVNVMDPSHENQDFAEGVLEPKSILSEIQVALATAQDSFFARAATIEEYISRANEKIANLEEAIENITDGSVPTPVKYLQAIVSYQQEAAVLEGNKEELESLLSDLATQVENLEKDENELDLYESLSGDADVYSEEYCIFDPYGGCTFSNDFCSDGYEFINGPFRKSIPIALHGKVPSSIAVSVLSTCGFRFNLQGFNVKINDQLVNMIAEGSHCSCEPELGQLVISEMPSIGPGDTEFLLTIEAVAADSAEKVQGYFAEAFVEIEYGPAHDF